MAPSRRTTLTPQGLLRLPDERRWRALQVPANPANGSAESAGRGAPARASIRLNRVFSADCHQSMETGLPVSIERMIASNAAMVSTISVGVMG